jgi:8-oxo-dGTP diphosphatase
MDKGLIVHTIIFNKKNQILILKRATSNNVLPDYWDIPGGTLKNGEDPARGAIRETKEEAGIKIKNPDLFFYTSNVDKNKNKQFIRLIFIAKYESGKIKVNHKEHSDYKWINLEELSQHKAVDYLYDCFELLQKNK